MARQNTVFKEAYNRYAAALRMDTARIQGDADRAAARAAEAQQLRLALRKSAHELIESARDRQIEQAKKRDGARNGP